ncbi:copper chaperone PCu(A)C [Neisseria musculi]|uniref:Copper chaperone PCu(A)C n=1 Tax=Neisseria musculi TaxID=1815583 RepID=A0A7H1MAC0_9NEIS|nr:copper chaperone PCu(A)C [Neisseria musculi]QNT58585.1 hypothetical protein H7A79_0163 [Neisseria musculi]
MKKIPAILLAAALSQTAWAADITVEQPWARATVEGMTMGGAFMNITNNTGKNDFLIGGSSAVADKVEVHTHVNDNGVMRMREVAGGIPLKAGQTTELKPGSYHIMFMGLKKQLKLGDKVEVTLKFKRAKPQTVTMEVQNVPKTNGNADSHGMKHTH